MNKGSSINQIAMTPIYDYVNQFEQGNKCLGIAILLASITCVLSTLCAFVLAPLDNRRERILKQTETKKETPIIKLTDAFYFPVTLWLIIMICVVL
jgi:hypothetical protein